MHLLTEFFNLLTLQFLRKVVSAPDPIRPRFPDDLTSMYVQYFRL